MAYADLEDLTLERDLADENLPARAAGPQVSVLVVSTTMEVNPGWGSRTSTLAEKGFEVGGSVTPPTTAVPAAEAVSKITPVPVGGAETSAAEAAWAE